MASGQKFLASQIAGDLDYKKTWNLGENKEDNEGIPFYFLLVLVMHCAGWNQCGKKWGMVVWFEFFTL